MSVLRRKLDVTELMTRIEAGGPKIALTLATLGVEVPSRQIQDRSGPKPMPFGKVFFLEIASPWSGTLDLRDDETIFACYRAIHGLLRPQGCFLNCDRFVEGTEPHIGALREAGFGCVECPWHDLPRAIVVADRNPR